MSSSGFSLQSLGSLTDRTFGDFATKFQAYLTSHARTGDPNKFKHSSTVEWPIVKMGPTLGNVLNATDTGFQLIEDLRTRKEDCDFWRDVLAGMTSSLGMNYREVERIEC
jgi:hypothetical protein